MSVQNSTAIPQDKPIIPADTPVKSRSTWNNFCVTVKKGCSKVGQFFKKIFQAIGNGFKAVGNFLWNNKVTVAIVAGLSAIALAISTLFLAMLGKKKKQSNDGSTKPVKDPVPVKDPKDTESKKEVVIIEEHHQDPVNKDPVTTVDKAPVEGMDNDRFADALNLFQQPPQQETQKVRHVDMAQNTGLIDRLKQQMHESEQKPKVETVTQVVTSSLVEEKKKSLEKSQQQQTVAQPKDTDDLHSSVDFGDMQTMLASINFGLGGPPPRRSTETKEEIVVLAEDEESKKSNQHDNSTESRLDSSALKARPRRPGRRLPARHQKPLVTSQD
jgi:hypothetical protein